MGLMDKLKQAAKGRSEMVEKGIDTAVGQVDKRTNGKYRDKLSKGAQSLKTQARRLDEERARRADPPSPEGPVAGGPSGEPPPPAS